MIDQKLLRTDPDRIRRSQQARGESVQVVDDLVAADEQRRGSIGRYEGARAEQKELGKQIPKAQGEEKASLLARTKELAEEVKQADVAAKEAEATFTICC